MANQNYDLLVTERINASQDNLVGENENYKLFIDYVSINGFEFLQFNVISQLKVKTLKGCKVSFINTNKTISIDSDSEEIESEYSNTLQQSIFTFDVDLEEELVDFINDETIDSIEIQLEQINFEVPLTKFENLRQVIAIQEFDEEVDELDNVDFEEI
jgi:hypothetical protein